MQTFIQEAVIISLFLLDSENSLLNIFLTRRDLDYIIYLSVFIATFSELKSAASFKFPLILLATIQFAIKLLLLEIQVV